MLTGFWEDFSACELSLDARATGTVSAGLTDEEVKTAVKRFLPRETISRHSLHCSNNAGDEFRATRWSVKNLVHSSGSFSHYSVRHLRGLLKIPHIVFHCSQELFSLHFIKMMFSCLTCIKD